MAKKEAEKKALEEASVKKKKKTKKAPTPVDGASNDSDSFTSHAGKTHDVVQNSNSSGKQQWNCSSCGMNNYADRLKCRRCGSSGGEERLQVRSKNELSLMQTLRAVIIIAKFVSKKKRSCITLKKGGEK